MLVGMTAIVCPQCHSITETGVERCPSCGVSLRPDRWNDDIDGFIRRQERLRGMGSGAQAGLGPLTSEDHDAISEWVTTPKPPSAPERPELSPAPKLEERYKALKTYSDVIRAVGWFILAAGVFGAAVLLISAVRDRSVGWGALVVTALGSLAGSLLIGLATLAFADLLIVASDIEHNTRRSAVLLESLVKRPRPRPSAATPEGWADRCSACGTAFASAIDRECSKCGAPRKRLTSKT